MTVAVEKHTSIAAIAEEWDALADAAGASPFVRPGWIGAWWDAFGAGRLEVIAVRDADGALSAVLPVARRAGGVFSTSNWHSPEWGVAARDDAAARAAFDALFASSASYVMLRFLGPGLEAAEAAARAAGYTSATRVIQESPYIELGGGFESLPRPHEKQHAKNRAKLERDHGEVTFEVIDGSEHLDELFAEGLQIEGSGWKLESGTAIVSQESTRRFYTELAHWAASRGILRLIFLRAAGRPIAFEMGIEDNDRFYFLKGGYDPEFRKFSPGAMIAFEIIRWSAERGLDTFEYLGAPEPAKLDWTDRTRSLAAVEAFSPRPSGRAARIAYVRGRPLAKRALAGLRRAAARGSRRGP